MVALGGVYLAEAIAGISLLDDDLVVIESKLSAVQAQLK